MNFYDFLLFMIVFMVCVIILMVILTLSMPLKIWVPSLDPQQPLTAIWTRFLILLAIVFTAFMVFLIIMYLIYKFLMSIPLIGPPIANSLPVFSDMKRAGLFDLVDNLLGALKNGDGVWGKIKGFFVVLLTFAVNSVQYVRDYVNGHTSPGSKNTTGLDSTDDAVDDGTNTMTEDEQNELRADHEACLEEHIVAVTAEDSATDRASKQLKNNQAKAMCAFQNMSAIMRTSVGR